MFAAQSRAYRVVLPLLTLALTLFFVGVVGSHAEAAKRLPDLIVSAVSAPSTAQSGQSFVFSASVKNQGRASATNVQAAFYLTKSSSSITGATLLGTQNVGSLPAGAILALTTTLSIPSSASSGTFYVVAVADPSNSVKESKETNNTSASGALTIQVPTPPSNTTSTAVAGHTYYVATTGSDANPGTETQPFRSLAYGVSVLTPGDTLYVMNGTYAESLMNNIPAGTSWSAPVTVAAYPGHTVTLKPNPEAGYVLHFQEPQQYIIIDGLILDATNISVEAVTLTSGPGTIEAAAHHIRIQNCEITNSFGNGLYVKWGYANEFVNLDIHHNGATPLDHGVYLSQDSKGNLIEGSRVHNNAGYGIHLYHGLGGVDNNIVRGNQVYGNGERGILLGSGTGNLAYNNLLWGNLRGGITINYGAAASNTGVYNNTLFANDQLGISIGAASTGAIIQNNLLYQNGGGVTDTGAGTVSDHNLVDIDPKFVNAAWADFHLQSGSPAIDTGITVTAVAADFDGTLRPQKAAYNIGAFE